MIRAPALKDASMADHMDIQFFSESGTWHRPPGAVSVEVVLKAGDGGTSIGEGDRIIPGTRGEFVIKEFPAAQMPETAEVSVGEGGRGGTRGDLTVTGGRPGWAVIITHLEN
jgi:hypothetical protein